MADAPNTSPDAKRGPRLWLRVIVFVSLAMNLLILGAVVGMLVLGPRFGDRPHPPRVDRAGGPLTAALNREDKREIGRKLRRLYRDGRPNREAVRAEYREVIAALRADPFDATRVEASLKRQLNAVTERQALGHEVLLDHLGAMSVEARRAYAHRLEEGLENEGRERRRKPDD